MEEEVVGSPLYAVVEMIKINIMMLKLFDWMWFAHVQKNDKTPCFEVSTT